MSEKKKQSLKNSLLWLLNQKKTKKFRDSKHRWWTFGIFENFKATKSDKLSNFDNGKNLLSDSSEFLLFSNAELITFNGIFSLFLERLEEIFKQLRENIEKKLKISNLQP